MSDLLGQQWRGDGNRSTARSHNWPFGDTLTVSESGRSLIAVGGATVGRLVGRSDARLLGSRMATKQRTIDYLIEQATGAGAV